MSGKKSGSVTPNTPDPKLSKKCDPLTKWAARAIFLFMTLATFSWLDTIKVKHSRFPKKKTTFLLFSRASAEIYTFLLRIDGTSLIRSICTSSSCPRSPHRPTTQRA
jgi:hypothetical protein